jgi:hypothetical protein
MRYLFGFLCVCALGVMPVVGCGEEKEAPCVEDEECDDGNTCTIDDCFGVVVSLRYCKHTSIDCENTLPPPYDSECATAEFEVCDQEAPEDQVCGAITPINGCDPWTGRGCTSCSPPGRLICLGDLGYLCRSGQCLCSGSL